MCLEGKDTSARKQKKKRKRTGRKKMNEGVKTWSRLAKHSPLRSGFLLGRRPAVQSRTGVTGS